MFDKALLPFRQIVIVPILWILLPWLLPDGYAPNKGATNPSQHHAAARERLHDWVKAGEAKQSDCASDSGPDSNFFPNSFSIVQGGPSVTHGSFQRRR